MRVIALRYMQINVACIPKVWDEKLGYAKIIWAKILHNQECSHAVNLKLRFSVTASQNISRHYQWCSRDINLRDRDLAQISRPRLCHKSRDRDLEDRDSRPHISMMVIKANSMNNAATK